MISIALIGGSPGSSPKRKTRIERADAAPEAEPDPARAHAEGDEADHDGALERDQDPVGRAHLSSSPLAAAGTCSCRGTQRASVGIELSDVGDRLRAARRARPRSLRAASVSCSIDSSRVSASSSSESCASSRSSEGVARPTRTPARPPPHLPSVSGTPALSMPSTSVSVACTPRSRPLRMKPVRPCGVSDCGSSPHAALALGVRMSSTIASISPRQTPTAPQTFCAHSPAGTGLAAARHGRRSAR